MMHDLSVWSDRWQAAIEASMVELGEVRDRLQRMGYNCLAHQTQRGAQPLYDCLEAMRETIAQEAEQKAEQERPTTQRRAARRVTEVWG